MGLPLTRGKYGPPRSYLAMVPLQTFGKTYRRCFSNSKYTGNGHAMTALVGRVSCNTQ